MNTCDKCKYYRPEYRMCWLLVNDEYTAKSKPDFDVPKQNPESCCIPESGSDHIPDVRVGPKFGCIHWLTKESL